MEKKVEFLVEKWGDPKLGVSEKMEESLIFGRKVKCLGRWG